MILRGAKRGNRPSRVPRGIPYDLTVHVPVFMVLSKSAGQIRNGRCATGRTTGFRII